MRIACPSCAAEYEVPSSRLPPGRLVRCVRCGGEWIAVHEAEEAPPPETPEPLDAPAETEVQAAPQPAPAAFQRLAAPLPPVTKPVSVALIVAWVVSFAVLAAAASATLAWKADIERAWPPSARLLR